MHDSGQWLAGAESAWTGLSRIDDNSGSRTNIEIVLKSSTLASIARTHMRTRQERDANVDVRIRVPIVFVGKSVRSI